MQTSDVHACFLAKAPAAAVLHVHILGWFDYDGEVAVQRWCISFRETISNVRLTNCCTK
jgi:hypothetical protein